MMQKPIKTYTLNEARRRMERFCAYRERCHTEIIRKLREMGMIPQAIDEIMAHLVTHDFLNEERFARNFAIGKFHQKKWGKKRIERELKHRQISSYLIKSALEELQKEAYAETFHELALKRLGQIRDKHPLKRKRKLADYLIYRGWEPEMVYEKVHELIR